MKEKLIWTETELPQGSKAWLEFRSYGLGGSEISVLMGANPWKTLTELWEIKVGFREDNFETNEAIEQGKRLEPIARADYERRTGIRMTPVCMVHPEYRWMRTSLDGMSDDGKVLIEIKCPKDKANHEKQTRSGRVPSWRYPQVQHQLAVTMAHFGTRRVDYYSYIEDGDPVTIQVYPDFAYINELIRREEIFFGYIERKERPPEDLFAPKLDGRLIAKG